MRMKYDFRFDYYSKEEVMEKILCVLSPHLLAKLRETKMGTNSGLPALYFKFEGLEKGVSIEIMRLVCRLAMPHSILRSAVLIDYKDDFVEVRYASTDEESLIIADAPIGSYDVIDGYF